MSTATRNTFTFINLCQPPISQHLKELQHSDVRAHTARVYHKRKKVQQYKDSQNICLTKTMEHAGNKSDVVRPVFCLSCPDDMLECSFGIHMPTTVKIYLKLFAPNVGGLCEVFGFPQMWNAEVLPYTAHSHCFAAFSALMQSAHDLVASQISSAMEPSQQVLRYKAIAIEQLRRELNRTGTANDASLMSMLFLAILASRLRDNSQRDVHRKAIGRLVKFRGGLGQVNCCTRIWLLHFEVFWAIETGQSLLEKPTDDSPTGPILAPASPSDIARLPSGFRMLVKSSKLSPRVVNLLVRTDDFVHAYKKARPNADAGSRDVCPQSDFWTTIAQLSSKPKQEPNLDALLHLGLLLFNYLGMSDLPAWHLMSLWTNMGRWVRKELTQGLLSCIVPRRAVEERCLLWLSSVAIGSWRIAPNELSVEGQMLATFVKRRFEQSIEDSNGKTRASQFFECERLCHTVM